VVLRQGDSALGVMSASTVASRSAITVGTAIVRAAEAVIRKGKSLAADALEAAEADIVYDKGTFKRGTAPTGESTSSISRRWRGPQAARRNARGYSTRLIFRRSVPAP